MDIKQVRREKRKNAKAKYNAFKNNHPDAFKHERDQYLTKIVDYVGMTKFPLYQFKLDLR